MNSKDIVITPLSYKKVQLTYDLPIYMIDNYHGKKLVETIKVSTRYQKVIPKRKAPLNYYLISIGTILQDIGFRNKVGKLTYGNRFDGITPLFTSNEWNINGHKFDKVLTEVHVSDVKYLTQYRDRVLTELFN